jgi:DNA-binding transcriptional LysR family regulator
MMDVELRHLRHFTAVAEERHFGRAAKRLRIAQPPLSRSIQQLEAAIGSPVFDRSRVRTQGVVLTAAGAALLEQVRRVDDAVGLALQQARRAGAGEIGRLAIGYPSSLTFSGLVEILRAFRKRRPNVELALSEAPPQLQLDALADGSIDVGFVRGPIGSVDLATKVVRREPLVVALPPGHVLAKRTTVPLSALAREPFVSFPRARGPAFFDHLMQLCRDAGFTPRIVQEVAQLDLVSLVAAGFGVALVPSSLRMLRRSDVVFRPISPTATTELFIAWRREDRARSPVLRDFLDVVERIELD